MIGGFLGSGKTTAILQFARWAYEKRGWKVAVITNDQANGLVDTSLANGARFAVHEIGGGCFCCQSGTLMEAMEGFAKKLKPEILIGEPVGSCTDLASTVLGPLRTIYKTDYRLSPLSVLVDPFRAARIVGVEGAGVAGFSEEVNYIYRKQLEEAEFIVVNKADVYDRKRLGTLCAALRERYPRAEVLQVSARTGAGLEAWWERLLAGTHRAEGFMPVDYAVYAEGEARLGWVNGEYEIGIAPKLKRNLKEAISINGNRLLETVMGSIQAAFAERGVEVAHLKLSLEERVAKGAGKRPATRSRLGAGKAVAGDAAVTNGQKGNLGAIQWVRTGTEPEFTLRLAGPIHAGRLLLNLRAEAAPEYLAETVARALQAIGPEIQIREVAQAAFRPSPPKPTHRLTAPAEHGRKARRVPAARASQRVRG